MNEPTIEAYNVVENVVGTWLHVAKADYVVAFCGKEMYVIKSRSFGYVTSAYTPTKPDMVIGYYTFPSVAMREIRLRDRA